MSSLRICAAQLNVVVGDLQGNTSRLIQLAQEVHQAGSADLLLCPELMLTGYPPEDLLLRAELQERVEAQLVRLAQECPQDLALVVGYPIWRQGRCMNAGGVLWQGEWIAEYHKQCLPNEQVFDEQRYFSAGQDSCVVEIQGCRLGILICEDLWQTGPAEACVQAGAQGVLLLNASPWHQGKQYERQALVAQVCRQLEVPAVYANLVGGQDELLFDGASFALNAQGELMAQAPALQEAQMTVRWEPQGAGWQPQLGEIHPWPDAEAYLYGALVLGLQDYVNKSGFAGVVLGLSGGIDSALSLAIAVDALGADRVRVAMLPYHYTSSMSQEDAADQAQRLGVRYDVYSIAPMVEAFMSSLADTFAGTQRDTTEENLQARCRGTLLMALSNKLGLMVLTTGNKSEVAVGYCTLYGDMVGGFNALKDVYKTQVFALARWRNQQGEVIPQRVIDRPPSAELAPDQKDEDSLPPYAELDALLRAYLEEGATQAELVAAGFVPEVISQVVRLVERSEYKRRQAAPGVRVSTLAFGKDRRYPLVNQWPLL
ncbi:NAD+ synthase [Marinospirillum sp.]|uniref:NAD+ synthase n=1 Tax=Marinospirillum sp. TaxID=2183934 RepID=UPI003A83EAEB